MTVRDPHNASDLISALDGKRGSDPAVPGVRAAAVPVYGIDVDKHAAWPQQCSPRRNGAFKRDRLVALR
jgi:hypothetical protein